jgi:hypothetical protein
VEKKKKGRKDGKPSAKKLPRKRISLSYGAETNPLL